MTASDGVVNDILRGALARLEIARHTTNAIRIAPSNGTSTFDMRSISTQVAADGWVHYCASWDTNQAAGAKIGQIYKNGVLDYTVFDDAGAAFTTPYTESNWALGATTAGANLASCMIKEFMFWPGVFIDWSDAVNLAKVYNNGNPVDPGADGSRVTGTAPIIYFSARQGDQASAFLTNRGTGGNFSQTGGSFVLEKRPIIAYGDSLVYGTGASTPRLGFHGRACRTLSPPWRRLNFGVGGESSTAIKTRFLAAVAQQVADYPNAVWIIEGGYNNYSSASTVIADHTAMLNALLAAQPSAKYIGMGVPNGGADAQRFGGADYDFFTTIESGLSSLYGSHFVSPWRYFVNKSVSTTTSQFFIDSGLTPTAQDLTDLNDDFVPLSARQAAGNIHWNDAGHNGIGAFLVTQKAQALGYG